MNERGRVVIAAALLVGALIVTFGGSIDNEFVNWDDGNYIVINPLVTEVDRFGGWERLTTPNIGYPVPLPMLLYAWLWALTPDPWPFHLLSLVVHALNAVLFFRLVLAHIGRVRLAWVAAAAFALHPIVVEPVAWATGLKDLLVGTGCLVAITWIRRGPPALIGAVVALASKPSAGLMGFALAAFTWAPRERTTLRRPAVWGTVSAIVLAGLGVLAFAALQETEQLKTSTDADNLGVRVLGAVGLQIEHLFVPAALSPRYPLASVTTAHVIVGGLAIAAVLALGVRWTATRDARLGWLALAVATYLPASNLRPLIRFTADSYVYVPWMAMVGVAAFSFVVHEQRLRALAQRSFGALRALVVLALPGWAVISHLEVETWSDTESLWASAAERYPDDGELVYRYGDALGRAGEREAELRLYLEHLDALADSPHVPFALPTWYLFEGDLERVDLWYARAFASTVRQDDPLYWNYVDYVARYPQRHRREHDPALAHALGIYADELAASRLDAAQLGILVAHAQRLGRPDVARRLIDHRADVLGSGSAR